MAIIPGLMTYSYHRSFPEGRMSAERLIARSRDLDLHSLEWCHFPCHEPGKVDWEQVRHLDGLARAQGIRSSLAGFAPLLSEGLRRDHMLAMVRTQLEVSRHIGATRMRFHGMAERELGIGVQVPRELCLENLRRVVALAEEFGVVIALENHMDFRIVDFRYFFKHISSPYLRVNLDTGNQLPLFEDTIAFAQEFADKIASCHLKGSRFVWEDFGAVLTSCPPGDSLVDLTALLDLLARTPRDIPTHIEVVAMTSDEEDALVGQYAEFIRPFAAAQTRTGLRVHGDRR
jgi:sugar phosphate isomerase/epimerase